MLFPAFLRYSMKMTRLMKKYSHLLFLVALPLLAVSCGGDDEGPEDTRPIVWFEGLVVDDESGEPIGDIGLRYLSELGCSALLEDLSTATANDGAFRFEYRKDIDTLIAKAAEFQVDTSYIYHNIVVAEPFFIQRKKEQGPREIIISRDGNLRPNKEAVLIRLQKGGAAEFKFEDVEYIHRKSIVEIAVYTDSETTPYTILSYYSDKDFPNPGNGTGADISALLPSDKDLVIRWTAKEGPSFAEMDSFEIVAEGEVELRLGFRETKRLATISF